MAVLLVPREDEAPWPTLGPQVCQFLEERAVHGPGDLKGQPYTLDDDKRALIYRAYEVYPRDHPRAGKRRFKRFGLSLRKGTAKCLDGGVLLTMADGSRRRADQVRSGDRVLAWDGHTTVPATVAHAWDQPPSPRYRVTTAHGRELTVTGEHPFLVQGTRWEPSIPKRRRYLSCDPDADRTQWVKAEELRDTDRLVTALGWADHGDGQLDPGTAWTLGAIVGDGGGDGRFTNADPQVLDRLRERFELSPLRMDRYSYYLRGVRPLLREHGLTGCNARTKAVPPAVFTAGRTAIAAFLSGYLDTDGHVKFEPLPTGKVRVTLEWASINHDLLEQCQHLLTGIGINAALRASRSRYKGEPYTSWKLAIHDLSQAAALADELADVMVPHKRAALDAMRAYAGRCSFGGRALDRVRTVERIEDGPTFAVEIAKHHTHVTAGVVTHNTELAAAIGYAELHPESPVRCDGFSRRGKLWEPVGRPVVDPYIPMVAYTEEQTDELAYAALYVMCSEGPDADLFDIGLDRILRLDERGRADGKAVALASSPNARDGARTTFQHFDEVHRFTLPRLIEAHETMLQNIPKRMGADPWSLETTTTYTPGERSVAEATHEEAEQISAGKLEDRTFFFFHREAAPREEEDLDDPEQLRAAIREASGPAVASWPDFDGQVENIASLYQQAKRRGNAAYFERVWLNRRVQGARKAFDATRWAELTRRRPPEPGAAIALGLDGSKWQDTTGIIATEMATGWQWPAGFWDPLALQAGEVPTDEVEALLDDLFATFEVTRLYGDPAQGFDVILARLASRHGSKRVVEFYTDSRGLRSTALAVRSYGNAMRSGELTHSGDDEHATHIGNCHRRDTRMIDAEGHPLWVIEKERRDSPFKIDLAMAGTLSWAARMDALAAGWSAEPRDTRVIVMR